MYDEIGNLVRDYSEQIEEIVWTVQGKVQEVHFEAGKPGPSVLQYEYDPMGNRLAKKKLYVDGPVDIRSEGQYYVRDPQGNVLAVYQFNEADIAVVGDRDSLYLEELHLYGSARLGILKKALALRYRDESGTANWSIRTLAKTALAQSSYQQLELGRRRYELSNHLGNVLATVSDKSLGQDSSQTGQADYYLAQVFSANLYYPFGWEMPGRKFVSGEGYRFGFNGQEEDPDMGVVFKYRVHDARVGRFLSVDPLAPDYPWNSCYAFAENRVIDGIDLEGAEYLNKVKRAEYEDMNTESSLTNVVNATGNIWVFAVNSVTAAVNGGIDTYNLGVSLVVDPLETVEKIPSIHEMAEGVGEELHRLEDAEYRDKVAEEIEDGLGDVENWEKLTGAVMTARLFGGKKNATRKTRKVNPHKISGKDRVDALLKTKRRDTKKESAHDKAYTDEKGTYETAVDDFNSLPFDKVKDIQTTYGPGKVGIFNDGTTVTLRKSSSNKGANGGEFPTLQVWYKKNGDKGKQKGSVKIRYQGKK